MKIKVKEIPQEGLELSEAIDALEIGFGVDELKVVSPLKVEGEVYKKRDLVVADLAVEGQYEFSCARCLEPVTVSRKDQFAVHIDIDPSVEFVDLGEEIRQELLLNISTIVLCQNDCKGLCPSCGVNLNNEKCHCKE